MVTLWPLREWSLCDHCDHFGHRTPVRWPLVWVTIVEGDHWWPLLVKVTTFSQGDHFWSRWPFGQGDHFWSGWLLLVRVTTGDHYWSRWPLFGQGDHFWSGWLLVTIIGQGDHFRSRWPLLVRVTTFGQGDHFWLGWPLYWCVCIWVTTMVNIRNVTTFGYRAVNHTGMLQPVKGKNQDHTIA